MQVVDSNGNVFGSGLEVIGSDGKPKGGAQGPIGPQGVQGITGIQGLVGIQGTIGTVGSQGITGSQGVQGITGIGTQGTQGITGTGLQGTQGVQGRQGTTGIQGLQGSTGGMTPGSYVFKAIKNGILQTIPNGVDTVVTFVDDFDPNNWFTSNQFQPTTAGYYLVNTQIWWETGSINNNQCNLQLRKNGTAQVAIAQNVIENVNGYFQSINTILYFNGSTDYIEVTAYTANPTSQNISGSPGGSWISAALYAYGAQGATGVQGVQGPSGGGSGGSGLLGVHNLFGNFQGTGSAFGITAAINAGNNGTYVTTASRLDVYGFIPNKTLTNCSLSINVTTLGAGVLSRVVIYADTNGFPSTKLYESTDIDCSTTGTKTILAAFTFTAGTAYWLGLYANGTSSLTAISTSGTLPLFVAFANGIPANAWSKISTPLGSAPDPFQYNTYRNNPMPTIWIKPT